MSFILIIFPHHIRLKLSSQTVKPVTVRVEFLYAGVDEPRTPSPIERRLSFENDATADVTLSTRSSHIITPNRYGLFSSSSPSISSDDDDGKSSVEDSPSSETPSGPSTGLCRYHLSNFTGNLPSLRQTGLLSRHMSLSQPSNVSSIEPESIGSFDDMDFYEFSPSFPQNQLGLPMFMDSPTYEKAELSECDEGSVHIKEQDEDELDNISDMQISRCNSVAASPDPFTIGAWPGSPAPALHPHSIVLIRGDEEIVSSVADQDADHRQSTDAILLEEHEPVLSGDDVDSREVAEPAVDAEGGADPNVDMDATAPIIMIKHDVCFTGDDLIDVVHDSAAPMSENDTTEQEVPVIPAREAPYTDFKQDSSPCIDSAISDAVNKESQYPRAIPTEATAQTTPPALDYDKVCSLLLLAFNIDRLLFFG